MLNSINQTKICESRKTPTQPSARSASKMSNLSTWSTAIAITSSVKLGCKCFCTLFLFVLVSTRFKDCYTEYARTQITDGVSELKCPGYQCNAYVEDDVIFGLFDFADAAGNNSKIKESYRRAVSEAYIVCNRCMLHCSTPDCEVVLKIGLHDHNVGLEVKCKCDQTLCSSCGEKWHDPVKCELLKMWKKKCDDDRLEFEHSKKFEFSNV